MARFEIGGRRLSADFARPLSIAIPLEFGGPQPSCFDAPPATARPFEAGPFVGDTRAGGSCNCELLTLAPHCNGTHTECVGHVTEERVAVTDCVKGGVVFALVVSIAPVAAASTRRRQRSGSCGGAICSLPLQPCRLPQHAMSDRHPRALVIRTLQGGADRPLQSYRGAAPAPYLSRQAAAWLVDRGIEHVVLDLPSADRADDGGRLTAHRIFFGLPAGSRRAAEARRPQASITELAWVPAGIPDGYYLLDLQIPAFQADAAPSRPLLYPVQFE